MRKIDCLFAQVSALQERVLSEVVCICVFVCMLLLKLLLVLLFLLFCSYDDRE